MGDRKTKEDGPGLLGLVLQLSKAFHRRSTEEMLGMRLKEFLVLGHLAEHRATTQQELGEGMLLDSNTMVLLLNELESRGFAVRRRDREDRRRHVVEITPEGRTALAKAEKARDQIEDEVFADLTADERQSLRRMLIKALEGQARALAGR